MSKIRVLLADDHTILRKGLRSLLEDEADIDVVAEARDGVETLDRAGQLRPDVILMDITMPDINGLEATRQIVKSQPNVRVVMLTMHENDAYIQQALRAGAAGYVVKQAAVTELVAAVRAVYRGDFYLSPSVSRKLVNWFVQQADPPQDDPYWRLTDRERQVLSLIAQGDTTREIARKLYVSMKTVETHRMHLMKKLNLHTVADLTRYAVHKDLIPMGR